MTLFHRPLGCMKTIPLPYITFCSAPAVTRPSSFASPSPPGGLKATEFTSAATIRCPDALFRFDYMRHSVRWRLPPGQVLSSNSDRSRTDSWCGSDNRTADWPAGTQREAVDETVKAKSPFAFMDS